MPQVQGQYAASGATWYNSSGAEEVKQVKAAVSPDTTAPGLLFCLVITNSNAATRFAYVFDNASASSGTPIVPPIPIAAGGQVTIALPVAIPFSNGLRIASSSTNATFTASTTNDFRMCVLYK